MTETTTNPVNSGGEANIQPNKKAGILITGATGLVGSHLVKRLGNLQKPVRALHRGQVSDDLKSGKIEWVKGDILDVIALEQAMENIDQVYHCAASVSFNPATKAMMFKTNIEGTANVVNAAINAGVKKIVFVSSVAALGRIREGQTINETMNWTKETSNSNYGKSKYLAELEVWRGIGEGLKAVMVNPVIILGAADWSKGSAGIFKSAYNEFPWYTQGTGGFVDVLDVVEIMIQLMESDISGERFIISAENTSYQRVFSMIAKEFGKKPPNKKAFHFWHRLSGASKS